MTTTFNSAEPIGLEIKRRLELRTLALGAETNLGRKVYLGRRNIDHTSIPCVVIVEGNDTAQRDRTVTEYQVTQNYVLVACLKCDIDNPNTIAHAAIRDMKRAIFPTADRLGATFNGRVAKVEYVGREISPRADGEAFINAIIEISVTYAENLANP